MTLTKQLSNLAAFDLWTGRTSEPCVKLEDVRKLAAQADVAIAALTRIAEDQTGTPVTCAMDALAEIERLKP